MQFVTRHFATTLTFKNVIADDSTIVEGANFANSIALYDNNKTNQENVFNLWEYCDMSKITPNNSGYREFYWNPYIDRDGEGRDASFYIDGTEGNDWYSNFSITDYSNVGHNIINDIDGDDDGLVLTGKYTDFNTFFNVYKDSSNNWQIGDDLILFDSWSEFYGNYEEGTGLVYTQINNFNGKGKIETIQDSIYNGLNYTKLDSVKEAVIGWLGTYGNGAASVMDVLNARAGSNTDGVLTHLANCYNELWKGNYVGPA